jgi:hypothetical protein
VTDISRRLRWWCKLAYPEIDTQKTKFMSVKFSSPSIIDLSYPFGKTVDITTVPFTLRNSKRGMQVTCGYSKKLDLCVIYDWSYQYDIKWKVCRSQDIPFTDPVTSKRLVDFVSGSEVK